MIRNFVLLSTVISTLLICSIQSNRIEKIHPDDSQKDQLHETFKSLLSLQGAGESDQRQHRAITKSSRAAGKYMRRLLEKYQKHEIAEGDGEKMTMVRAVMPKIGHTQNRESLTFALPQFASTERLIKAEIHYYLGNNAVKNVERSKRIRCHLLIDRSIEQASAIETEEKNWAVFDISSELAAKLGDGSRNETVVDVAMIFGKSMEKMDGVTDGKSMDGESTDGTTSKKPIDPVRYLSVRKTLRFHAPFLSVSSIDSAPISIDRGQPIDQDSDDDDDDEESAEIGTKPSARQKREVDNKYYEYYHPFDTPFTTSPNDVAAQWPPQNAPVDPSASTATSSTRFVQRGPSVLRRTTQSSSSSQSAKSRRKKNRRGSIDRRYQDRYLDENLGGGAGSNRWTPLEPSMDEDANRAGKGGRKKKYGKVLKAKEMDENPTTVVLMGGTSRDEQAQPTTCQRNDLVVDFQDIGWGDYIIAPSSFEAHYCAGSCPFPIPSTVNATNHAIVLDIIQKIRLHPQIPKPCCAPEKMDSLSLLYYDANGNVVLTTYPKMSVLSCACL